MTAAKEDKKVDPKKLQQLPLKKKPSSEREEKHLRELGEYEFKNIEEPGQLIKFFYGNNKNGHTFTFLHGGKYTVPRFIAQHLEECSTPIPKWVPDGTGTMNKQVVGDTPRFQMREVFR